MSINSVGVVTHSELVHRAAQWLRSKGYTAFTEFSTKAGEVPDAIGFKGQHSCVIECKSNYADFCRDRSKWFRIDQALGMGYARYFMAPAGLIPPEEIHKGWGLLEVGKTIRMRIKSRRFLSRACYSELRFLSSMVRRTELRVREASICLSGREDLTLDRWLKYDHRPLRKQKGRARI